MRIPGLTKAEAAVAAALLRGLSLSQIAAERATSIETVRSQTKAIYAKAHVRGQVELILKFAGRAGSH